MMLVNSEHLLQPIAKWLHDDSVSEIVLNKPGIIFVEQQGAFTSYNVPEFHEKTLMRLFRLIANENSQSLNERNPLLSGVLPDGSRIQLIVPPVTNSYCFAIRKKRTRLYEFGELKVQGFLRDAVQFSFKEYSGNKETNDEHSLLSLYCRKQWGEFIKKAIKLKKNIVISGATSSGKTTFLNACLTLIPLDERLIILEDTSEVRIAHKNSLRLIAFKDQQGMNQITMQDLLQCSLRLRPDRIIVGEVRGKEILDFISASLTGHAGVITSIHAENPRMAFTRMTQMYKLNGLSMMTDKDIENELKQSIDIIFQLKNRVHQRGLQSVYFKEAAEGDPMLD